MMRLLVASLLVGALAGAEEPVATLHAEGGWFEEAFALDDAGGRVALVKADGQGKNQLEVRDLEQRGAVLWRAPLTGPAPSELQFLRAGVLALTPGDAGIEAVIYDASGKPTHRFGPATQLTWAERDGRELVVVRTVRGTSHEILIHDLASARPGPIARRQLVADGAGLVGSLELSIRGWRRGGTQVAGRRPGRYDRKLDQRLNDSEAVYDLIDGAFVRDAPAKDLMLMARISRERDQHPGLDVFVGFAEDGSGGLLRVGADDSLAPVDLAVGVYDPDSLIQTVRGDEIVFSLTVDPLNPDAVGRKKRDPEVIDFYRLLPGGAPPARRLRISRDGRDFVWRAGGSRLALLRKHKAFGRGGPDLEVYDLPR